MVGSSTGTLVLRLFGLGVAFFSTLVVARAAGPDQFGTYAWAIAWAGVLQIVAVLGFDRLAIREISAGEATHDRRRSFGTVVTATRILRTSSAVFCVITVAASMALLSGDRRSAMLLAGLSVPFLALSGLRQGAAQGLNHVVLARVPEDVVRPVVFLVAVAVIWAGVGSLSSTDAMLAYLGSVAAAFLVGTALLRKIAPPGFRDRSRLLPRRPLLRAAVPQGAVSIGQVALTQLGLIVLGIASSSPEVALFAIAQRIGIFISLPEYAANAAFFPHIARLHALGEREQLRTTANYVSLVSFVSSVALAAPTMIFAQDVLSIFGAAGDGGATTLRWVCAAWVFSALAGTNGSLLSMSGQMTPVVSGIVLALVSNVVLCVWLVPDHGASGAGAAWLVTGVIWNVFLAVATRRLLGFWATPVFGLRRRTTRAAESTDADPRTPEHRRGP